MRHSETYRGARRNSARTWKRKTNDGRWEPDAPSKDRMRWGTAWNLTQKAAAMQLSKHRKQRI